MKKLNTKVWAIKKLSHKSQLCIGLSICLYFSLSLASLSAQHNSFTFEGGYAKNYDDGWKINGLYEYHPKTGKFVYGMSVGYVRITDNVTGHNGDVEYAISTIPLVIAPKFLIGNGSLQGFVKTDLGYQFSTQKRLNLSSEPTTNDSGFYGGLGAGIMKSFGPKYFVHLQYERAFGGTLFYTYDLQLNSIMIGLGSRFD